MKKISSLILITLCLNLFGCEEVHEGQYLEKGVAFFDQGKYKESKLEIKNAIQENPLLSEPYYYLALINEKEKKYKAMRANLLESVKLDPKKTKAHLKLSKVQLLFNNLDEASYGIESVLADNPAQLDALAIKSSILMRQKNDVEAAEIIDDILKVDANHVEAISLKVVMLVKQQEYDKALALLVPTIAKHSDNISLHLLKTQIDSKKNDIDAVIADYEKLVEIKPDNVQVKFTLAKVYQKANKLEKAETILNQLVDENPDSINAKTALLSFLFASDQEKAISTVNVFVEQHKDNYERLVILSNWLATRNQRDKAQKILETAITNNNISAKNKVSLNLILARLAFKNNNTTKALAYIDQVLADNAEDVNAKVLKSEIQISLNQFSDAKKLLEEVLWQQPNMDLALSLIAKVYEIEGNLDKAILNYENALKLNPKNTLALNFIVSKEISEGHTDYAIKILQRALKLLPKQLSILTQLVELHINENKIDVANKYIQRIQQQQNGVFLAAFLNANLLQRQKQYQNAIDAYKALLEKAPWLKDALTGMAESYSQLNQQAKMMVYLDGVIKSNPNNIFPTVLKSRLLTVDKKYKTAISLISKTLERQEIKDTLLHEELGRLYNIVGDAEKAQKTYIAGLKIAPNNINLMMSLAPTFEKQKAFNDALKLYKEILSINPRHNISKNNLATLLLDQFGKPEDIANAVQLIEPFKQSKNPYFLDTYGWGQLKSGQLEQALSIFKQVTIIESNVPVFRYHLAVAYNMLGDAMSATSELKQALYLGRKKDFAEKVLIEKMLDSLKNK